MSSTFKEYRSLMHRAVAALETPGDLTDEERKHLVEDLQPLLDRFETFDDLHEECDLVLSIEGGGFIGTSGDTRQYGAQVTIYDPKGREVQTWVVDEWQEPGEGELVMGAILNCAADGRRRLDPSDARGCPTCHTLGEPSHDQNEWTMFKCGNLHCSQTDLWRAPRLPSSE